MFNRSQAITLLLGISLGLLLGIAASSFAWLTRESQRDREWLHDYGNALAGLSASQAIDSVINHDLVSLQVILQDVMSNPRMLSATIHDVENKLLVQSGASQAQLASDKTVVFSRPIPLHDSDAGYVTVILSSQGKTQTTIRYTIIGVGIALLLSLIGLLRAIGLFFNKEDLVKERDDDQESESFDFDSQSLDARPSEHQAPVCPLPGQKKSPLQQESSRQRPALATAKVIIYLTNREILSKQLSHQLFIDAINDLELLMRECAEAYSGRGFCETVEIGRYRIEFPSYVSADEARFRALCFSELVKKRYEPTAFRIDLSFLVALRSESVEHRAPEPSAMMIYVGKEPMGHELSSRVIIHMDDQDYCSVKGFPAIVLQQIDAQYASIARGDCIEP